SKISLSDHSGTPVEYTEMQQLFEGLTLSYNRIAGTPSPLNFSMRNSDRFAK
ncbi:MAG TPA: GntR family transcriptional regulator, partial [Corynebacterium stationis]|nr:GntR family transcriptional regulator [Corynebacterium stationis]